MSRFIQLHMLTSYPPANLNRDDLGRPKTAVMGGRQRLRVSSQCLKRTWRTSPAMRRALEGHLGLRTRSMGDEITKHLQAQGVEEEQAREWAGKLTGVLGTLDRDQVNTKELFYFTSNERKAIEELARKLAQENAEPQGPELMDLLARTGSAVDVALFGRMMAKHPASNVEAAAQVAHAISVHEVAVEQDYFSAVDDLNEGLEDLGAGHIGEAEFAAGLFYIYACLNQDLLLKNLDGDQELAKRGLRALVEAMATSAPKGKISSYGSHAYASYLLAEKGDRQPRSLSVAFLKPVGAGDMLDSAIKALEQTREALDQAYGPCAESQCALNVPAGSGSLSQLLDFVTE